MTTKPVSRAMNFTRSLAVQQHLLAFIAIMTSSDQLQDGVLTARFIGEFSAGKTRLLRELFGEQIPSPLLPVSSLERQTRLPLEITYGDTPELALVKRPNDHSPATFIKAFTHFPERNELHHYDPMQHRLRLTVKEPRLILPEGDGFNEIKCPMRLFLIDTPGWNSGDDEVAELGAKSSMTGMHNLAVVYVCQAARLDGKTNADHLRDFMQELADAEFLGQTKLMMVVTSCPEKESAHLEQRAQKLAMRLWQEVDGDEDRLELNVFCVDFKNPPAQDLQLFRDRFWNCLLAPLGGNRPALDINKWAAAFRQWPKEWDLNEPLLNSVQLLDRAKDLLGKARLNGEFVVNMNMHRLLGYDAAQIREKVLSTWLRQLASDAATLENWSIPTLPEQHPLAQWWLHYWQAELEQLIGPVRHFFQSARRTINELAPAIEDLGQHLDQHLETLYHEARSSLDVSFASVLKGLPALLKETAAEKRIATLLSLSLLQTRYEDYYFHHRKEFAACQ